MSLRSCSIYSIMLKQLQIQVNIRTAMSAGLGSSRNTACSMDSVHNVKAAQILAKTRERYNKLDKKDSSDGGGTTAEASSVTKAAVTHTKIGKITWHKGQTINHVKDTPRVNLGGDSEDETEDS